MFLSVFQLKSVPDLTLVKYQTHGKSGIEDIIERHNAFLRQWQRISIILKIGVHLCIQFEKRKKIGNRIRVILILSSEDKLLLNRYTSLMEASPVSDFFDFVRNDDIVKELHDLTFTKEAVLKKRERTKNSLASSSDPKDRTYYTVEKWESNENARLYDMIKVMTTINQDAVYCCSFYGVEAYNMVNKSLEKVLTFLRKRTSTTNNINMNGLSEIRSNSKDISAEDALKVYEDFLTSVSSTPYFSVNIRVLSNEISVSHIILDAACGESIDKGDCEVASSENVNCGFSVLPKTNFIEQYCNQLPESISYWPTLFSLEELSPFFRFPTLNDAEQIDMPKETAPIFDGEGLHLGLSSQNYSVDLPVDLLKKHAFISGVPGSGKTNTMLHLCYTLWSEYEIPFLVLEPAKKEYRALAKTDIDKLLLFSPSSGTRFPLAINPFEFALNMSLSEHIQNLMDVFKGSFPLPAPLPALLDRAIENVYKKLDWDSDDINCGDKSYPTMSQLYKQLEKELEETDYDGEVKNNMKSALEMRIGGLLRRDLGNLFDVKSSTLSPENWLKYPVIIEMESLGSEPSNFLTLMLCTLIREALRVNPICENRNGIRHIIFIEEAHNLISSETGEISDENANPKVSATNFIVKMLAEVRALNEGIIIADQLPTAMPSEVLKNTGLKIVHRITAGDDRGLIGSTMSASETQVEELASFLPGQTLVFYEGLLKPFKVKITEFSDKDTIADDELNYLMESRESSSLAIAKTIGERINKLADRYKELWSELMQAFEKTDHFFSIYQKARTLDERKEYRFAISACELKFNDLLKELRLIKKKCQNIIPISKEKSNEATILMNTVATRYEYALNKFTEYYIKRYKDIDR